MLIHFRTHLISPPRTSLPVVPPVSCDLRTRIALFRVTVPMNYLKTVIVVFCCGAAALVAAEVTEPPVTLKDAREAGRLKSRFLKESVGKTDLAQVVPEPDVKRFQELVAPILQRSCLVCHGPDLSEGRLRVDRLDPDLLHGSDVERWREIYNVLSNSEMPPSDEEDYALDDSERSGVVEWLSEELNKASIVRRNNREHSSFRRLTRYEYNYALQDLLGIPWSLADKLPPETPSEDGFKNSSELLQMSVMQFETYREIGREALKRVTVSGERPEPVTYIVSMQDEFAKATAPDDAKVFDLNDEESRKHRNRAHLWNRESGQAIHYAAGKSMPRSDGSLNESSDASPVVLVLPRSNELKLNLDRFLPDGGVMRVRIRAGRSTMNDDEYASLRLIFSAHTSNNANFSNVISASDVPVEASADAPEFIHFDIPLDDIQRNPFRKLTTTFPRRDEFLHIRNISNARGGKEPLQVLIDRIEISAPFYEQWPPKTHTEIFFDSDNRSDEAIYGREVLTRFLRRVWRRPATTAEVDAFMELFATYRPDFTTFEDAMVEVLATVLATPEFLYVIQRTQGTQDSISDARETVSDLELASRLSLFLWSSIPDDELLDVAGQGRLSRPDVLSDQVTRMLADRRASRFAKNFVEQWLGMDGLESVAHVTDSELKEAMRNEPVAFFNEVLRRNGSIMDFIHSDYVVVNERLAAHYRIPNVAGPHFRKVSVDESSQRGGLLTAAAFLAMNSDGKDSHPLKRGVWMLERILHDPPPPPPPNVPEVDLTDPEILKMTLKERIADHRNKPACYSCHSRIDPWGIAFEHYDAMGAYRSAVGGKPVDATSTLFNKQTLAGMDGLKRYLLSSRQDQLARAMVHKMIAYALGRPLSFGDRADIDSLTAQFRKQGDGLGDLVHLVVASELFRKK